MKKYKNVITLYHDIEQDIDSDTDPDACIEVVYDFLRIEKKYNISATYNIVGSLFTKCPEMVKEIIDQGYDVAFHSNTHNPDWSPEIYKEEVELCRKIDSKIIGYRSPRSKWDENTLHALWKNGFLWNAESDTSPVPYFIYKGVVRLPIALDDWGIYMGKLSIDDWVLKFRELLGYRKYFGIGTHDFVFSKNPEKYLSLYEKVINIVLEQDILISSFSQVADLYRRVSLSNFYTNISKNWNRDTKVLYRTKRFKELIRNEAEKLNNPVVADLGSGGGVLSTHLKDIASRIYCVDNSPGMLDDIKVDDIIELVFGEVTNSSLPSDSVDFIICARVLEYMTTPDHVANEIKRIGKLGGKFLVTVPALQDVGPSNEGGVPDKLRKHFTAKEVIGWASQIGSGELIGIHYFEGEPKNDEEEAIYRNIEKEQPEDFIPTNWVFIGTIENKDHNSLMYKSVPLNFIQFDKV